MQTLEIIGKVLEILLHRLPFVLLIVPFLARRFIASAETRAKLEEATRLASVVVAAADSEVRAARRDGAWTRERSIAVADNVRRELVSRMGSGDIEALEARYGYGLLTSLVEAEVSRLKRGATPPADAGRPSAPETLAPPAP